MPLRRCSILRLKAGDEVANAFARFPVKSASAPDCEEASGVGKGALHGARLKHGHRALLDSAVPFLWRSVRGGDFGK